jgi:hypothetical protein
VRGDGAARGPPGGRGRQLLAEGERRDLLDADSLDDGVRDGVPILHRSDADQVRECGRGAEDSLGLLVAEQLPQLGGPAQLTQFDLAGGCRATLTTRASIFSARARS